MSLLFRTSTPSTTCCRSILSVFNLRRFSQPPTRLPSPTSPSTPSPVENSGESPSMAAAAVDEYGIEHRTVKVNGINMHVAEKGGGEGRPTVLFVHGFPELWFSWRHQISALADLGYRAVAPDMRGYGGTDAPAEASAYTYAHTAGDLVALIDALVGGDDSVFVVGHDWGAMVCWQLCLFRPDRVKALVNLSVPFTPRNPARRPVEGMRAAYGNDHYICRFQNPGEMEAVIAAEDGGPRKFLSKIFSFRDPAPLFLPKERPLKDEFPLPPWLPKEDFAYFVEQFEKTGFTGGFNYYRALTLSWEITAPWTGSQVKVPVKFIVGDMDLSYHLLGAKDYVSKGGMKKYVPFLQDVVVLPGVGHFIQQERPDEITQHIYQFIQKFS